MSDNTSIENKHFKVVLVGDGGTGKTSFIVRQQSGEFQSDYVATLGVEKYPLKFNTTHGTYTISLWDTSGQEKLGPMRDSYYEGADAAILFFDVTSRITYKNIPGWHQDIVRVRPNIPVVLCANKTDVKERKVKSKSILYPSKHAIGFYEISVKENMQLMDPIQYLLQKLTNICDLKIISCHDSHLAKDEEELDSKRAIIVPEGLTDIIDSSLDLNCKIEQPEKLQVLCDEISQSDAVNSIDTKTIKVTELSSSKEISGAHSIPNVPCIVGIVAPPLFSSLSTSDVNINDIDNHNSNALHTDTTLTVKLPTVNAILKPSSFGCSSLK